MALSALHNQLVRQDEMITPEVLNRAFLGKLEKPMMLCEGFRTVAKKMRDKFERGDVVEATGKGEWRLLRGGKARNELLGDKGCLLCR